MKPTLPEDREPDETGDDVTERYREVARDEPTSRLDARIIEAARREVARPPWYDRVRIPIRREWQVPASIAAVLVLAVSLGLIVRDNEPPLLPGDGFKAAHPSTDEAKLARAAPPQLAMKDRAPSKIASERESRPSRDRSERPDRQLPAREAPSPSQPAADSPPLNQEVPAAPIAQAPAAAPADSVADAAISAKVREQEQAAVAESSAGSEKKKAETSDKIAGRVAGVRALSKPDAALTNPEAKDWIRRIEDLLAAGKQSEAKDQLAAFRERYPDYPLSVRLQAPLPAQR